MSTSTRRLRRTGVAALLVAGSMAGTWAASGPVSAAPVSDTASNSTDGVVDGSSIQADMAIDTAMTVTDVEVAVDFAKVGFANECGPPPIPVGYAFNSEISFRLRSPTGAVVTLVSEGAYSGGTPSGAVTVTFDDDAATGVSGTPTTGTFRPAEPLSAFDGEPAAGTWSFAAADAAPGQPLCFYEVRLTVNGDDAPIGASAPVCTVVKTDWRAPNKDGSCPAGETLHNIATTTGPGLTVCTKVKTDWRAPDNVGCPVGFTTQKVVTTTSGGLPVCVHPDTDWRDPYKDGTCPAGTVLYRVVETGIVG
jgi:hypothetical protein